MCNAEQSATDKDMTLSWLPFGLYDVYYNYK